MLVHHAARSVRSPEPGSSARGVTWVPSRSRRSIPTCRLEPSAPDARAATGRGRRTAHGAIAASIAAGERLSTADATGMAAGHASPCEAAAATGRCSPTSTSGHQSHAELDVVRACREAGLPASPAAGVAPRIRRGGGATPTASGTCPTAACWCSEIDGGFHREASAYALDMRRQRKLATTERIVVRCAAEELRVRTRRGDRRPAGIGRRAGCLTPRWGRVLNWLLREPLQHTTQSAPLRRCRTAGRRRRRGRARCSPCR